MQSIPNWSVDTSIGQPVVASELATSIEGAAASQLNLLRDLDPKKKSFGKANRSCQNRPILTAVDDNGLLSSLVGESRRISSNY